MPDASMTELVGDQEKRVFVTFAGRPRGKDWDDVIKRLQVALEEARATGLATGAFKAADLHGRRGSFLAFASGVSFGGGQKVRRRGQILKCGTLLNNV